MFNGSGFSCRTKSPATASNAAPRKSSTLTRICSRPRPFLSCPGRRQNPEQLYHEWAGAPAGDVTLDTVRLELHTLTRARHLIGLARPYKSKLQRHRYYIADGFQACHISQCFDAAVETKIGGIDEHRVCCENQ
jgi:hypothetical protein